MTLPEPWIATGPPRTMRAYGLLPDRLLVVVVVECTDGSKALVKGVLRSVPDTHSDGVAMRIVVSDATARPLDDAG